MGGQRITPLHSSGSAHTLPTSPPGRVGIAPCRACGLILRFNHATTRNSKAMPGCCLARKLLTPDTPEFLTSTSSRAQPLQMVTHGSPPCPRAHHTATLLGDHLYVLGGFGGKEPQGARGSDCQGLTDVHVLHLPTKR